jgi:hypothetical protein
MERFNAACDWLSQRAVELALFTKFKLQASCYQDIRLLFGLSAQATVRVCAKVADAYAISKIPRTFKPTGAIVYDLRLLSWNLNESRVSIWAMPGRLSVQFVCSEQQRKLLSLPRGQSDLIYRDGNFYLHTTIEVEGPKAEVPSDLIGVDLGVANIAFDSDGNSYSGTHLNRVRHRHHALRQKLQKKGTKSAKRLLKRRSRKEQRFATNANHIISKSVVALAQRTERGLALEELDGIRERIRAEVDQRYRLHSGRLRSSETLLSTRREGAAFSESSLIRSTPARNAASVGTPKRQTERGKASSSVRSAATPSMRIKTEPGTFAREGWIFWLGCLSCSQTRGPIAVPTNTAISTCKPTGFSRGFMTRERRSRVCSLTRLFLSRLA